MARTSLMTLIFLSPAGDEDDVELGLLFGGSSGAAAGARSNGNSHGRSGGNAPLLFQQLGELSRLEDGESRQVFDDLFEISHL